MPVRSTNRLCAVLDRFLHTRVWFWISEVPSWSRRGARAKRGRGGTKDAKLPYRRPRSAPYLMRCASRISVRSAPIGAIVETTPAARTRPPLLLQEGTSPPRKFHLSDYFGQHCLFDKEGMKAPVPTVIALALILVFVSTGFGQTIRYSVSMPQPSSHVFQVEMTIDNPGTASLDLALPAWNGLYQIRDF